MIDPRPGLQAPADSGRSPNPHPFANVRPLCEAAAVACQRLSPLTVRCSNCASSATKARVIANDVHHAQGCWVGLVFALFPILCASVWPCDTARVGDPSAADLDTAAEEQRAAELTSGPSRCGLCTRLSSATPRHEHWCRRAGENCPGCMTLGEAHVKSCRFGVLLHHPEDTCCPGVDLPGIGCAHTLGCPVDRPVLRVKVCAAENLCGASESVEVLSGGAQCL